MYILGENPVLSEPQAEHALEALQKLDQKCPDLIILDIMLPGIHGFKLCSMMKSKPNCADIPVIMLTALGEPKDKVRGFDQGAAAFITKPFEMIDLINTVNRCLGISSTD